MINDDLNKDRPCNQIGIIYIVNGDLLIFYNVEFPLPCDGTTTDTIPAVGTPDQIYIVEKLKVEKMI